MAEDSTDDQGSVDRPTRPAGDLSRFEAQRSRVIRTPSGAATRALPSPDADGDGTDGDGSDTRVSRVGVDDEGVRRPFMLGILVHSLTESGLSFEDAYEISREVWGRIRDRSLVTKSELRDLVSELAGSQSITKQQEDEPPALGGPLEVAGSGERRPFSQIKIQQSFLAAGLDPRRAFELVSDIEWRLRGLGARVVSRDAIRKLATELLTDQFGPSMATRYAAYRRYQNDDGRPIIVLLGGTSGVGKSTLALEVARRLLIGRVTSTDSIRDVMRVMVSDDLVPTLHVSSFEAHERLSREPASHLDPVIEGFLEQTRTISVGIRAVIERAVIEGTSLVLDGVSLVPGFLDVHEWSGRAHVFSLLAAELDRESLHGHLIARAGGPGTRAPDRYVRNFQEIFRIQEDLLERAEAAKIPIVDVQDLESAVQAVVKHVVGGLGVRREAECATLD